VLFWFVRVSTTVETSLSLIVSGVNDLLNLGATFGTLTVWVTVTWTCGEVTTTVPNLPEPVARLTIVWSGFTSMMLSWMLPGFTCMPSE
jgi:hypothetical protein